METCRSKVNNFTHPATKWVGIVSAWLSTKYSYFMSPFNEKSSCRSLSLGRWGLGALKEVGHAELQRS